MKKNLFIIGCVISSGIFLASAQGGGGPASDEELEIVFDGNAVIRPLQSPTNPSSSTEAPAAVTTAPVVEQDVDDYKPVEGDGIVQIPVNLTDHDEPNPQKTSEKLKIAGKALEGEIRELRKALGIDHISFSWKKGIRIKTKK